MGYAQRHIDLALWVTANLEIEALESEAGTRVLNYLSTLAPQCPAPPPPPDGNFPLGPPPSLTSLAAFQPSVTPLGRGMAGEAGGRVGEEGGEGGAGGGVIGGAALEAGGLKQGAGDGGGEGSGLEGSGGQRASGGVEELWDRVGTDLSMCKALRTMENGLLLSHALRCLEDDNPLPLWLQVLPMSCTSPIHTPCLTHKQPSDTRWLQDLAKSAAADRAQFLSWDDGSVPAGMRVGRSCRVCRRPPHLPPGQWATATGAADCN